MLTRFKSSLRSFSSLKHKFPSKLTSILSSSFRNFSRSSEKERVERLQNILSCPHTCRNGLKLENIDFSLLKRCAINNDRNGIKEYIEHLNIFKFIDCIDYRINLFMKAFVGKYSEISRNFEKIKNFG